MRRFVRSMAVLCLFAGPAFGAEWVNTLKPTGTPAAQITLSRDGAPLYSILLPAAPSAVEKNAAGELQHWLQAVTGAELPITSDPAAMATTIRIMTDPTLGVDGYRIAVDGPTMTLAGAPGRGVMNAVYAFLEEDLGCRWYTKTDVRLPHVTAVAPVPRTYVPQLKLRDPFYFVSFDPDWSVHNRTNAPDANVPEERGGHIDYGGLFVHTEGTLMSPDTYFKDHPEYYQQNPDGKRAPVQLCTTNANVRKLVTDAVLATLRKNPHTEVVSVSRLDVMQVCHCAECEKLRTAEGSEMANQLLLVNQVADAVEKEFPAVMVDTLAYLETLPVPKTMRPRKNVIIRICNDAVGAWSHPFTPAEKTDTAKYVAAWSAVHDKLSIWDYNVNFSHYLAPMPNVDVIAANIRYWAKNKAWGVMTQGAYQGSAERDELRSWLIAKLLWDPSLDEKKLTEEFILGHYKQAAPAMLEYDALLVKAGADHAADLASPPSGIRYPMDVTFLSKDFLAQASAIFEQGKRLAGNDEALLHAVERAELPILYVKLSHGVDAATLAEFDRVTHREGVTHLAEVWPGNLDSTIAAWRKQLPPPATTPAVAK